jgi:dihydroxyacid dehydratase/phosphogluconate dehydratase
MLHLRNLNILHLEALTVSGETIGDMLEKWEKSERRKRFREILRERDNVDPDDVILSQETARVRGMKSTLVFVRGNLAPEGAVIKSTAIDPSMIGEDGVYRHRGPAKVFVREKDVIKAIKNHEIQAGDVVVLAGRGPMGSGMEEIYQITSALRHLPFGKHVAVLTDARFSGVSTGACIGHIGPEALANGPIGKLQDGDQIQIIVDCTRLTGSVDWVGDGKNEFSPDEGARRLQNRPSRADLSPDENMPTDTRLWAALQQASGGIWGGCVYDAEAIIERLRL